MCKASAHRVQLGLCCLFNTAPIAFKTYSFATLTKLAHKEGIPAVTQKILAVWAHNRSALQEALYYCATHAIAGYRISSDLYPQVPRLLEAKFIDEPTLAAAYHALKAIDPCGRTLSMHPGQHVNLGSPTPSVVANSLEDLRAHCALARPLGCTEINIHLGGRYGDKASAINRFIAVVRSMEPEERALLTLENDELNFSLDEVVAVATTLKLRAVYDLHHQRCYELKYPATGTEEQYAKRAKATWPAGQTQRLHLSSPREGFLSQAKARPHADYIDLADFPQWLWQYDALVDVEAKAKENAIEHLQKNRPLTPHP